MGSRVRRLRRTASAEVRPRLMPGWQLSRTLEGWVRKVLANVKMPDKEIQLRGTSASWMYCWVCVLDPSTSRSFTSCSSSFVCEDHHLERPWPSTQSSHLYSCPCCTLLKTFPQRLCIIIITFPIFGNIELKVTLQCVVINIETPLRMDTFYPYFM